MSSGKVFPQKPSIVIEEENEEGIDQPQSQGNTQQIPEGSENTTSCGEFSKKIEISSGWMVCSTFASLAKVCSDCSTMVSDYCVASFPSLRVS